MIISSVIFPIITSVITSVIDDGESVVILTTIASAGSTEHYADDTDWYAGDAFKTTASAGDMGYYAGDNNSNNWYAGDL